MGSAINKLSTDIKNETLCESLTLGKVEGDYQKDWKIGDEIVAVEIVKA